MKKRILVSVFVLVLSVALAACGSSKSYDSAAAEDWKYAATEEAAAVADMAYGNYAEEMIEPEMPQEGMGSEAPKVDESASSQRKLIKTVDLSVETKEYDNLMLSLETQIEELGGYIESLGANNGGYYNEYRNRSANITARIPVDKLDGFVKQIGEEANVVSRNESVEDVTLRYVDLDSHARMLEEEQERLLELLESAETVEEIIIIEGRLSEVKYQLESMKSQLRTFDNKIEYSTVHIYIDEVEDLTPVIEQTTGERIAEGFAKNVENIKEGIQEFFIELIINIPYIIVWAIIIAVIGTIVFVVIKIADKRSARLRAEKQQGKPSASVYVKRPTAGQTVETSEDKTE